MAFSVKGVMLSFFSFRFGEEYDYDESEQAGKKDLKTEEKCKGTP